MRNTYYKHPTIPQTATIWIFLVPVIDLVYVAEWCVVLNAKKVCSYLIVFNVLLQNSVCSAQKICATVKKNVDVENLDSLYAAVFAVSSLKAGGKTCEVIHCCIMNFFITLVMLLWVFLSEFCPRYFFAESFCFNIICLIETSFRCVFEVKKLFGTHLIG